MQQVHIKLYGNIYPINTAFIQKLEQSLPKDIATFNIVEEQNFLTVDKNMLLLCFEGIYFSLDQFIESLSPLLTADQNGKLDYFDLENWLLTRHLIVAGKIETKKIPLNNALDTSYK